MYIYICSWTTPCSFEPLWNWYAKRQIVPGCLAGRMTDRIQAFPSWHSHWWVEICHASLVVKDTPTHWDDVRSIVLSTHPDCTDPFRSPLLAASWKYCFWYWSLLTAISELCLGRLITMLWSKGWRAKSRQGLLCSMPFESSWPTSVQPERRTTGTAKHRGNLAESHDVNCFAFHR